MRTLALMIPGLISSFVLLFLGGTGKATASTSEQGVGRVLVLPFYVSADSGESQLREFSEHAYRTLRSAIDLKGSNFLIETHQATEELLRRRPGPASREEAVAIAEEAGAKLVIFGFLSKEGDQYRMNAEMWDLVKGRTGVATDLKSSSIYGLPQILRLFVGTINKYIHGTPRLPFYRAGVPNGQTSPSDKGTPAAVGLSRGEGPWRSAELAAGFIGLDIGDIDGDKKNETVLVEEGQLTVSRFEGGSLTSLAQFTQHPVGYLSAELEDLDGDNQCELILCYQTPKGLESEVFRYAKRSLQSMGKFPNLILRTISDPADEKRRILVGQDTDSDNMFSGDMVRFGVKDQSVIRIGKISLPPGTLLLSYVSGRLGRESEFLQVVLNQDRRLTVFDRENRLVHSVTDKIFGLNRAVRLPAKGGAKTIVLPGRLLIADTDGDGENELLVTKQSDTGCTIQDFAWDGTKLNLKWKTVESPGIISDFCIKDFKNEGTRSLVLLLVRYNPLATLFGGARTIVYAYDLTP